ncbi:MAG: TlpA family protein disulfide reductase [Rhodobacteraceae bacterium]|nr:TlpA family protein disulfide reductase [Paracoccaceae bacterium]
MRLLHSLTLYIALSLSAIAAPTLVLGDMADIAALREGSMKKLQFHSEPKPVSQASFLLEDGTGEATLGDYKGKYILLNFWATWCPPCRKEMPYFSELQASFGGDNFEVLTLATGRNSPSGIVEFFDSVGITNLPRHRDPKQTVARDMAVLGLPVTVILNPQGVEIARMHGDAEWNSESARAIISALMKLPAS